MKFCSGIQDPQRVNLAGFRKFNNKSRFSLIHLHFSTFGTWTMDYDTWVFHEHFCTAHTYIQLDCTAILYTNWFKMNMCVYIYIDKLTKDTWKCFVIQHQGPFLALFASYGPLPFELKCNLEVFTITTLYASVRQSSCSWHPYLSKLE